MAKIKITLGKLNVDLQLGIDENGYVTFSCTGNFHLKEISDDRRRIVFEPKGLPES